MRIAVRMLPAGVGQQRGIVPVRPGQHPVQRDAVPVGHAAALQALLARSTGLDDPVRDLNPDEIGPYPASGTPPAATGD
jgi:hypothetical protein